MRIALTLLLSLGLATAVVPTVAECAVVEATDANVGTVAELISDGWYGRADDGREAVYSPAC